MTGRITEQHPIYRDWESQSECPFFMASQYLQELPIGFRRCIAYCVIARSLVSENFSPGTVVAWKQSVYLWS
jgi:hypothetical protein